MDDFQAISTLKRQVKELINRYQQELHALELVERMLMERRQPGAADQTSKKVYRGMKQNEAIQDVLEKAGGPMTAAAIADALERGGFPFKSKDPKGPVYAALKQSRQGLYFSKKDGQNVKFGLARWKRAETAKPVQ